MAAIKFLRWCPDSIFQLWTWFCTANWLRHGVILVCLFVSSWESCPSTLKNAGRLCFERCQWFSSWCRFLIPYHSWDWYIYLRTWVIFKGFHVGKYTIHAWRIIPFSEWLITMVSKSPIPGVVPFINGRTSWLINRGVPNHLHPLGWSSKWMLPRNGLSHLYSIPQVWTCDRRCERASWIFFDWWSSTPAKLSNIAMENPPFWRYLLVKMGIFMGCVSLLEGRFWKLMVGRRSFPIRKVTVFREELLKFGRVSQNLVFVYILDFSMIFLP